MVGLVANLGKDRLNGIDCVGLGIMMNEGTLFRLSEKFCCFLEANLHAVTICEVGFQWQIQQGLSRGTHCGQVVFLYATSDLVGSDFLCVTQSNSLKDVGARYFLKHADFLICGVTKFDKAGL